MARITYFTAPFFLFTLMAAPALALDLNPFSAIVTAVEAVAEDRSSEDIAKDLEIKASITADVVDQMGSDVISISADVYEQDVMLTGSVEKDEQKKQAGKLAASVDGVKKLYNEILVITDLEKKKGAAEGFVEDTVIEKKINALLLDGKGVNVTNFRWRAVSGNVFLFGRALSKAELSKAVGIVKEIEDVISVTNRVKVRAKEE